jgi:hypothetical protein
MVYLWGGGECVANVAQTEMEGAAGMDAYPTVPVCPNLLQALGDEEGVKRVLKTGARGRDDIRGSMVRSLASLPVSRPHGLAYDR